MFMFVIGANAQNRRNLFVRLHLLSWCADGIHLPYKQRGLVDKIMDISVLFGAFKQFNIAHEPLFVKKPTLSLPKLYVYSTVVFRN